MYSLFLYPQLIDKFMEKSLGNNIQAKQRILYTYMEVLSENDTSGYEQTDIWVSNRSTERSYLLFFFMWALLKSRSQSQSLVLFLEYPFTISSYPLPSISGDCHPLDSFQSNRTVK